MKSWIALFATLLILGPVACRGSKDEPAKSAPPASELRVTEIKVGRSLDANKEVSDETGSLSPADTVYVSVVTEGSAPRATLTARWTYEDGQVVDESSQTIAPAARTATEFHISKPDGWPAGEYRVDISLNGEPAGSKEFEVKSYGG